MKIKLSIIAIIAVVTTVFVITLHKTTECDKEYCLKNKRVPKNEPSKLKEQFISKYNKVIFFSDLVNKIPAVYVPQSLWNITGITPATFAIRIKEINNKNSLNSEEQKALLCFLHKSPKNDPLSIIRFNAVKNQVVVAFLRQRNIPPQLLEHLVSMAYNKNTDYVWRDYCIQFTTQLYEYEKLPIRKKLILNTAFEFCNVKNNTAATAIISLANLKNTSSQDKKNIANIALKMAENNKLNPTIRATALQVASRFNNKNIIPCSVKIIDNYNKHHSVFLYISAIATLGDNGTKKELDLLQNIKNSRDTRISYATKAAIKKLTKKLNITNI